MFIVDETVSENNIAEITKPIITTPSTNQSMNTNTAKPRAAGILIVGGGTSTELYLPDTGKTCLLGDLPEHRHGHTLDSYGSTGAAILCGGGYGVATLKSCLHFSPSTAYGNWTSFSTTLKDERIQHTSWMTRKNQLTLFGGMDDYYSEVVNGNESFWLKAIVRYSCAISDDKSTIITGGLGQSKKLVIEYNQTGYVKTLPSLSEARWDHGCGSYYKGSNRILVVAGGRVSFHGEISDSTEVLDMGSLTPTWTIGKKLPRPLFGVASINLNNSVVLIGGLSGENGDYTKRSKMYSFNGSWTQIGTLQHPRRNAAATTLYNTGALDITGCK